jgi:hypothetical protein
MVLFLLAACSTIQFPPPPEFADDAYNRALAQQCEQNYVHGNWQFVHSITFEMANGHGATVIGVTVLDGDNIKAGLMGVEGFVLFEAELGLKQRLVIKRALPPFDNAEFAAGLMRDVKSIFVLPSGDPVTSRLADGEFVCRYQGESKQIIDLIIHQDGSSTINEYDDNRKRIKTITADRYTLHDGTRIPERIQLNTRGLQGYTLNMVLISADKIVKNNTTK